MTDQDRYKYMEYYKWNFKSKWYSAITDKLVLATRAEMGFLGMYNQDDFVEFTKKKRQEHSMRGFEPEDLLNEKDCNLSRYELADSVSESPS